VMGRRNGGYGSTMPARFVASWRVIGRATLAVTLLAGCAAEASTDTSWMPKASMEIARSEIPAAVLEETIYVPGGLVSTAQGVGVTASVERYRADTDRWESVADLPEPRHHTMSVALAGRVYVLGGFGNGFNPWATAWAFDPQTDEWTDIADLPTAIGAGAVAEIDGYIYLVGGIPDGSSLYAYDPAANTWESLGPMTQAREHTAAVAFNGDLWVLGGRWEGEMLASVEVFDPESGSWSSGPKMQEARSGFGATVLGDSIFVAGGEVFDQSNGFVATALDSVERFDSEMWSLEGPLPRRLHGVPLSTVGESIYLLGGSTKAADVDNTGEVWSLQP